MAGMCILLHVTIQIGISVIQIHFANDKKKLCRAKQPDCRVITADRPPKITQFSCWSVPGLLPRSLVLNGMTHALRYLHPQVVAFQDTVNV
jgi:hypothetical protein